MGFCVKIEIGNSASNLSFSTVAIHASPEVGYQRVY
jgi:hypothetical protein